MLGHQLRLWWGQVPTRNPIEKQQAVFFQAILLGWVLLATIGLPLNLLRESSEPIDVPPPEVIPLIFFAIIWSLLIASLMLWLSPVISLILLRRGRFKGAVMMAVWGLLFGHSIATFALGVKSAEVHMVYQVPLVLAGLLGSRRMLLTVATYNMGYVILIGALQLQEPAIAGLFSAEAMNAMLGYHVGPLDLIPSLVFFVAVTLLLTLMLDRFGNAFRNALQHALEREQALETAHGSLEATVSARTAELATALDDVRQRADAQAALLAENQQQRDLIREMSVPVLPISRDTLVMPLIGALDSARLAQIQEQALGRLEATHARRLLLDITGVPIVDSQVAQGLIGVVHAARLLGAEVILVGIRPEVAQAIVGLGIHFGEVRTHSDLQSAINGGAR